MNAILLLHKSYQQLLLNFLIRIFLPHRHNMLLVNDWFNNHSMLVTIILTLNQPNEIISTYSREGLNYIFF